MKQCGGSSSGHPLAQIEACAHMHTKMREWGAGGRKRRGGGRSRMLKRAAAMRMGGRAWEGEMGRDWTGARDAPFIAAKK